MLKYEEEVIKDKKIQLEEQRKIEEDQIGKQKKRINCVRNWRMKLSP